MFVLLRPRSERSQAMGRRMRRVRPNWLRRRTRAMCVTARAGGRATHARPEISQISGDNLAETSFAGIVSDQGSEATVAGAMRLRAAASHKPRAADPRGGISDPGAGPRRTQT